MCGDGVETFGMHLPEGYASLLAEFMAGMFKVVEIDGVVDNALGVHLVVAYFYRQFKNIVFILSHTAKLSIKHKNRKYFVNLHIIQITA